MDWFKNFTLQRYLVCCLAAILIPIIVILPLLVNGEYTEGTCVNHHVTKGRSRIITSIIEFQAQDGFIYTTITLDNFIKNGEKVSVVYDSADPYKNKVLTFTAIYLSLWSIITGLALLVCSAYYYATRDDKHERAQKDKWVFKNAWKGNPFLKNRRK